MACHVPRGEPHRLIVLSKNYFVIKPAVAPSGKWAARPAVAPYLKIMLILLILSKNSPHRKSSCHLIFLSTPAVSPSGK